MNKNLTLRPDTLVLRKETLRQLDTSLLVEIQGGGIRSAPSCNAATSHQSQHSSRA